MNGGTDKAKAGASVVFDAATARQGLKARHDHNHAGAGPCRRETPRSGPPSLRCRPRSAPSRGRAASKEEVEPSAGAAGEAEAEAHAANATNAAARGLGPRARPRPKSAPSKGRGNGWPKEPPPGVALLAAAQRQSQSQAGSWRGERRPFSGSSPRCARPRSAPSPRAREEELPEIPEVEDSPSASWTADVAQSGPPGPPGKGQAAKVLSVRTPLALPRPSPFFGRRPGGLGSLAEGKQRERPRSASPLRSANSSRPVFPDMADSVGSLRPSLRTVGGSWSPSRAAAPAAPTQAAAQVQGHVAAQSPLHSAADVAREAEASASQAPSVSQAAAPLFRRSRTSRFTAPDVPRLPSGLNRQSRPSSAGSKSGRSSSPWRSIGASRREEHENTLKNIELLRGTSRPSEVLLEPPAPERIGPSTQRIAGKFQTVGPRCSAVTGFVEEAMVAHWHSIHKRVAPDGDIHSSQIQLALEIGHMPQVSVPLVERVLKTRVDYPTLDKHEFVEFVAAYTEAYHEEMLAAFKECDADQSGMIEMDELMNLLPSLGFIPGPAAKEIFREIDADKSGVLEFIEFQKFLEVLHFRKGFTEKEFERILGAFKIYDSDGSASLDAEELRAILQYLNYPLKVREIRKLIEDVDVGGCGSINEAEFLICMQRVHQREVRRILATLKTLPPECEEVHLARFVRNMGYVYNRSAAEEMLTDVGLKLPLSPFGLDDAIVFLDVYRSRDGLTHAEAADIEEAFCRFAARRAVEPGEERLEISGLVAWQALRWLGYHTSRQVRISFIKETCIGDADVLGLAEFKKLVRKFNHRENQILRRAGQEEVRVDPDDFGSAGLSRKSFCKALERLGSDSNVSAAMPCLLEAEDVPVPASRESLTSAALSSPPLHQAAAPCKANSVLGAQSYFSVELALLVQARVRKRSRLKEGFSPAEVLHFRAAFDKADADSSGEVDKEELRNLVLSLVPEMAEAAEMRPALLELLREADGDGDGSFSFEKFLCFMRPICTHQELQHVAKERGVVESTGFTRGEVEEFRKLFFAADTGEKDYISFEEFASMLRSVTPLGTERLHSLREAWNAIVPVCSSGADFPDMLILMKRLWDADFASLHYRCAHVARAAKGGTAPVVSGPTRQDADAAVGGASTPGVAAMSRN